MTPEREPARARNCRAGPRPRSRGGVQHSVGGTASTSSTLPRAGSAFVANAQVSTFFRSSKRACTMRRRTPMARSPISCTRFKIVEPGRRANPGRLPATRSRSGDALSDTACNLRCTYCYAVRRNANAQVHDARDRPARDRFRGRECRSAPVALLRSGLHGGGEPTVHWPFSPPLSTTRGKRRRAATRVAFSWRRRRAQRRQIDWIVAHVGGVSLSATGCRRFTTSAGGPLPGVAPRPGDSYAAAFARRIPYGIRLR